MINIACDAAQRRGVVTLDLMPIGP
jgi:hypothetical protein